MTIRRSIRAHVAVYAFFLAAALHITWPLVTVLSTHFAGYPFGDAHEMTRHIWWFKYAIQHGQPLFFQPLLGYPDGMQGVILWSDPLQFFPAWLFAFFMPLPAAYNLQCLLNMALNGWAAYFLVWKLTNGQRLAALAAGLIFMGAPVMQGHLAGGHGGLLVQWPLPLLAYSLIRLRQTAPQPTDFSPQPANRRLFSRLSLCTQYSALSTFFFVLLPLGHTLQLIYAGLPLIAVFGLTLLLKREWRALARLVAVVAVGSAILILFLLPVIQSTFGTAAYADEGGGVAFSLDLLGVVSPSFNHPVYGQLAYTRQVLGVNLVEGSSYIGLIAGLLALVALWKKPVARWWLLLAMVAWILALGPLLKIFDTPVNASTDEYSTFITLPWALVADLPGFNLARTPGRFGFVLALAVAAMAGYGVAVVSQKWSAISPQPSAQIEAASANEPVFRFPLSTEYLVLSTILFLLLLFDYQSYWPLPTYSAEIPAAVYELAARDDVQAVFDLPWNNVLAAKDALWLQTAHEKPLIAGQVTRKTPVSPAKLTILEQSLNPKLLSDAGVDVIILHKAYDLGSEINQNLRRKIGEPYFENNHIALFNIPEPLPYPVFWSIASPSTEIINQIDLYVYIPEPGWAIFQGTFQGIGQDVILQVDNIPIHDWSVNQDISIRMYLPLTEAGYHVVTLKKSPACPQFYDVTFTCPAISAVDLELPDYGSEINELIQFGNGITLRSFRVPDITVQLNKPVWIDLWWQFDQPRSENDIRFIKLIDKAGNQVAGIDETLGIQPTGNQWVETAYFSVAEVPAGNYRVCVGWYSYPDLTRFAVLSDVEGSQDDLVCVGEFTIPAP